jgi:hypothetical protein
MAPAMGEIELTRTAGDRRLYALGDVGTIRFTGWLARSASAEAGGRRWEMVRSGWFRRAMEARDATGQTAGRFVPHGVRRGGTLRWLDRELELRPASRWRERYVLADGARELATLAGQGWGRRPVRITLDDSSVIDPGLLLFAAFVVRGVAQDASGGD